MSEVKLQDFERVLRQRLLALKVTEDDLKRAKRPISEMVDVLLEMVDKVIEETCKEFGVELMDIDELEERRIEFCDPNTVAVRGVGYERYESLACVAVLKDGRHVHVTYVSGHPLLGRPRAAVVDAGVVGGGGP